MKMLKHKKTMISVALVTFGAATALLWPSTPWPSAGSQPETQAQAPIVREFRITAQETNWMLGPDMPFEAWTYNGTVPGPEIRVKESEVVRIIFKNELPVATTLHPHGVDLLNAMDGVPGMTQKPVQPGETFIYEFIARPAGTRFYHSHGNGEEMSEADQLDRGLYGALIIEPADPAPVVTEQGRRPFDTATPTKKPFDREYTLILDEWRGGAHGAHGVGDYSIFTINGKAFPLTAPLKVKRGERVRLRLINAGTTAFHPIHLHGHQFKVVATDGNPVPLGLELTKNTITVMPGETYDIEFIAENPGDWLLHCHELHHAGGGMVTLVQYE
jgi:FtsP/CotA-like multicopper oxidase with cupredoxin domain